MKMYIKSVMVDDQAKALSFYTEKLGFTVKHNISMGEHSWITLISPEEPNGVELALEPNVHAAAKTFQEAMIKDGIPFTAFRVDDVEAEHKRLIEAGVTFTQDPKEMGPAITAVLDDTCGNLIQIIQFDEL